MQLTDGAKIPAKNKQLYSWSLSFRFLSPLARLLSAQKKGSTCLCVCLHLFSENQPIENRFGFIPALSLGAASKTPRLLLSSGALTRSLSNSHHFASVVRYFQNISLPSSLFSPLDRNFLPLAQPRWSFVRPLLAVFCRSFIKSSSLRRSLQEAR